MPGQRMNILVVSSQPARLAGYRSMLHGIPESLLCASTAAGALGLLEQNEVALILIDVSLADMHGFDLAARVHKDPRWHNAAILFVSETYLADQDRIRGYQSGGLDFILIPTAPELLCATVRLFLGLYRRARDLEVLNNTLEEHIAERRADLEEQAEQVRELSGELRLRLDESKERIELMDLASEAIIVRRLDGTVRYWNSGAATMYGWTASEAVGARLHDMLQTEFPIPFDQIQSTLGQGERWEGNLIQKTKDGREIVVACRKSLKREEKKGDAVLEICRDVTSQLQGEEALRRADKLAAMGKMAGIVAHEINNPLGAILNIVYLLGRHPSLDDEARHYVAMAEKELLRVAHITRQTLAFYRDSSRASRTSVPSLLDEVLSLESHQLSQKGIFVERRYRIDAVVAAIPGELKQVFLNLIKNAIESMPQGGHLVLHVHPSSSSTGASPDSVRISIMDNGAGITRHDARRLFEPFFSTKSAKGTGLGLWISKGIIQKYEGRIAFRSVNVGGRSQTCFSVVLPLASDVASTTHLSEIEASSLPDPIQSVAPLAS